MIYFLAGTTYLLLRNAIDFASCIIYDIDELDDTEVFSMMGHFCSNAVLGGMSFILLWKESGL